ncbi:hypothetical protein [Snodgrassella communis]|uniref:hypothetical protein n=1 Tax=Snodgrassella communis TaxID=2946699 RepID=UPI0011863444|nr:hypothetical protein [Snodgrassella communis]
MEEKEILPLMINGDDEVIGGVKGIAKINNEKEAELTKRNKLLDISHFNDIQSPIWDYTFTSNYFIDMDGYREACKNYK